MFYRFAPFLFGDLKWKYRLKVLMLGVAVARLEWEGAFGGALEASGAGVEPDGVRRQDEPEFCDEVGLAGDRAAAILVAMPFSSSSS